MKREKKMRVGAAFAAVCLSFTLTLHEPAAAQEVIGIPGSEAVLVNACIRAFGLPDGSIYRAGDL